MNKFIALAIIFLTFGIMVQRGSCRATNGNSDMTTSNRKENLPTGIWGGQHIHAEVTESHVEIEFDCARGSIPKRIVLDDQGRFDVSGKFIPEHAGPIRRDEESNERAVQYVGVVKEKELTLTISDPKTKEVIGTFTLKHGNEGRIRKCR